MQNSWAHFSLIQGVCLNERNLSIRLKSTVFITFAQNMGHLAKNTHTFVILSKKMLFLFQNKRNFDTLKISHFCNCCRLRVPAHCLVSLPTFWIQYFLFFYKISINITQNILQIVFWYKIIHNIAFYDARQSFGTLRLSQTQKKQ